MTTTSSSGANRPLAKFRAGAIAATVWQNSAKGATGEVKYLCITLDRRYQDKNGQWQSTSAFRTNDLPRAGLVLQKAYEHIVIKQNHLSGQTENMHAQTGVEPEEEVVIA